MTVEIHHERAGSRAPPPPYLEALTYPLTSVPRDDKEGSAENGDIKKCPEIQDGGISLYPTALLANNISRSNSVCSGCSVGVQSNSLQTHAHSENPHSCRGSCESCAQEGSDEVTSFMSKKQCLSHTSLASNKQTGSSPGSLTQFRPYSPQPGPSGYNGSKGKGRASSTVKFTNGIGNYKTGATSDSSDNIYSTNCTVSKTSLNEQEEEPNNSAADRGTLYCACGILVSIIALVLLLVNFA